MYCANILVGLQKKLNIAQSVEPLKKSDSSYPIVLITSFKYAIIDNSYITVT